MEKKLESILNDVAQGKEDAFEHCLEWRTEDIIRVVCNRIEKQHQKNDENSVEIYVRYFHVLTLFGIPKNSCLVPATGKNLIYDISYYLWALDDGSKYNWKNIEAVAEYVAAALNRNEDLSGCLICGIRHP